MIDHSFCAAIEHEDGEHFVGALMVRDSGDEGYTAPFSCEHKHQDAMDAIECVEREMAASLTRRSLREVEYGGPPVP